MNRTEGYGILKKSTELLGKMDIGIADQRSKRLSLQMLYKTAESELLTYIKKQVAQVTSLKSLTDAFVDACFGLGALGMRQDLIHRKLVEASKSGQEALQEAIEKDTQTKQPTWGDGLPFSEGEPDYLNAYNLSNEAYESYPYLISSDANKKALSFVFLLYYVQEYSCDFDLTVAAMDLQYNSCFKVISNKYWAERCLAGYFSDEGTYNNEGANHEFLSIFGQAFRNLLDKSKDYFEALQIKQFLHEQIIKVYADSNGATPLEVYVEIEKLMTTNKRPKGITQADYEAALYSSTFAVTKRYEASGLTYELNIEGLKVLAELLEALELGGLQEVNVYMGKVKRCTCA